MRFYDVKKNCTSRYKFLYVDAKFKSMYKEASSTCESEPNKTKSFNETQQSKTTKQFQSTIPM